MSSTTVCVNELLKCLSAGVVLSKSNQSDVLKKAIEKHISSASNLDNELRRLLIHMRRIGLVQREKLSDGNVYIMLSAKGKKRLMSIGLSAITIPKPNKWDGKWRVVSFDIPRELRARRYELLRELHRLGFEKLLQSMWVFPHPCENEVRQLATTLGLMKNVVYLEAKLQPEKEAQLRTHFLHLIK